MKAVAYLNFCLSKQCETIEHWPGFLPGIYSDSTKETTEGRV